MTAALTDVPSPAEAMEMLTQAWHATRDRRVLGGLRCLQAMVAARTRSEAAGPPRCRWCEAEIIVTSKMGKTPIWCSEAHRKMAERERHRQELAAASKPVPVTSAMPRVG